MRTSDDEILMETLNVSREAITKLREFQELILKWNKKINLISTSSEGDIWSRHIIDSLQLYKYLQQSNSLVDIGSGAGLPGIVLSIAGIKNTILVESNQKKAAFLLHASTLSSNKIEVVNSRSEDLILECDILTARAWANIDNLFKLTRNIIVKNKYLILKGKTCNMEIDEARKYWNFDWYSYPSITSTEGVVLAINNLTKLT